MSLRRLLMNAGPSVLGESSGILSSLGRPSRWLSMQGVGNLPEKEAAEERLYFNKEDEKLLKNLLSKVKTQADKVDKHGAAGTKAAEMSALSDIINKYKISEADVSALVAWKHANY